jgi:hypothetical protein
MRVWHSVQGDDPVFYEGGYGAEVVADGWLDVALCVSGDRVRLILEGDGGQACVCLDEAGLVELHRRIAVARDLLRKDL